MIRHICLLLGMVTVLIAGGLSIIRRQEPRHAPWIAYQSDPTGNWDIFIMRPDGSHLRQLTDDPRNDQFPMWSPDGLQIAFFSDRDGIDAIYILDIRTGDIQRRTPEGILARHPVWSPDGEWIAFTAQIDGEWGVYRQQVNGNRIMQPLLEHADKVDYLTYSPDGQWIAFVTNRDGDQDLFLMRPDGSDETQLTNTFYNEWGTTWLDNEWLAYAADRNRREDLYAINIVDGREKSITQTTLDETLAAWSPDQQEIIYVSWGDRAADLFRILPDKRGVDRLTYRQGRHWAPVWSPIINLRWRGWIPLLMGVAILGAAYWMKLSVKPLT